MLPKLNSNIGKNGEDRRLSSFYFMQELRSVEILSKILGFPLEVVNTEYTRTSVVNIIFYKTT